MNEACLLRAEKETICGSRCSPDMFLAGLPMFLTRFCHDYPCRLAASYAVEPKPIQHVANGIHEGLVMPNSDLVTLRNAYVTANKALARAEKASWPPSPASTRRHTRPPCSCPSPWHARSSAPGGLAGAEAYPGH
jgi:hypothetical protein